MKKLLILAAALPMLMACSGKSADTQAEAVQADTDSVATVYFVKDITPENLVRIYEALGMKAEGNKVGVKISTGESNKSNQLDTGLIAPLVRLVDGTIIECNTAYRGSRFDTESHRRVAAEHGYTAIAEVDIMDADGDTLLPVEGARHLVKGDYVGKHYTDYDFTVVLSHFKGHQMGGLGGALKNISIGIGSRGGKAYIHSAGYTTDPDTMWAHLPEQDAFLESMAEAAKAVIGHADGKILYINVANNLSVDCDCNGNPAAPEMGNIGILASLDPVALDRASVDMVHQSPDSGKVALIERIDSRHGTHILDYGEKIGIGTQKYRLVDLDEAAAK